MTPPTAEMMVPEKNEKGLTAVDKARAIVIKTNEDFTAADQFSMGLKALEKEVDAAYDEHIAAAFAAHKSLVAKKKKYAEPIDEARKIIRAKMGAYQDEQEALRVAEEARLRIEAKKKAEDEALARASAMEAAGQQEEAAAIIEAPILTAPVSLAKSVPKAQTVIPRPWTFRITDINLVPRAYLIPNEVMLGAQARSTKGAVKVPGVEFFQRPL